MEEIRMLNGDVYQLEDLEKKMLDDNFYYNTLNRHIALSSSSIKDLVPPKSPKAWYYGSGKKPSDASLRAGQLFHNAILEPEKYEKLNFSKFKTRTSAGFKAEQEEVEGVLYSKAEKDFNDKLLSEFTVNKKAMDKLRGCDFEVPAAGYIDEIPFRGKADIVNDRGAIIDLKTTGDLEDFPISAYKYGYDIQCVVYCELMGADPLDYEFIVISKNTYDIGFFKVDKSFVDQGKERLKDALNVYKSIFWNKTDEEIREILNESSYENTLYSRYKYKRKFNEK